MMSGSPTDIEIEKSYFMIEIAKIPVYRYTPSWLLDYKKNNNNNNNRKLYFR